jgi:hypothetical protein
MDLRRAAAVLRVSGADRDRTGDPLLAKQVLSQLSYRPEDAQVSDFPPRSEAAPGVKRARWGLTMNGSQGPTITIFAMDGAPDPLIRKSMYGPGGAKFGLAGATAPKLVGLAGAKVR